MLLAVILTLALGSNGKQSAMLLTIAVCCMIGVVAMSYLKPVLDFIRQLQAVAQFDNEMLEILLKVVGIGIVGQVASLICTDAGSAALGKSLQLLSSGVILWLSLPLLTGLLELVQQILGEV